MKNKQILRGIFIALFIWAFTFPLFADDDITANTTYGSGEGERASYNDTDGIPITGSNDSANPVVITIKIDLACNNTTGTSFGVEGGYVKFVGISNAAGKAPKLTGSQSLLKIFNESHVIIENIEFAASGKQGISVSENSNVIISHCTFTGSSNGIQCGTNVSGKNSNLVHVKDCSFNNTTNTAVVIGYGTGVVESCAINNCKIGLRVLKTSGTIIAKDCSITGSTDIDMRMQETGMLKIAGTTAGTVELCEDAVFTVLKSGDTYQRLKDDYTTETVTVGTDWTGTAEVSFASGAEPTTSKPVVNITTTGSGNKLPSSSIPYFEKQVFLADKTGKYAIRKNKDGTLQAAVHSTSW